MQRIVDHKGDHQMGQLFHIIEINSRQFVNLVEAVYTRGPVNEQRFCCVRDVEFVLNQDFQGQDQAAVRMKRIVSLQYTDRRMAKLGCGILSHTLCFQIIIYEIREIVIPERRRLLFPDGECRFSFAAESLDAENVRKRIADADFAQRIAQKYLEIIRKPFFASGQRQIPDAENPGGIADEAAVSEQIFNLYADIIKGDRKMVLLEKFKFNYLITVILLPSVGGEDGSVSVHVLNAALYDVVHDAVQAVPAVGVVRRTVFDGKGMRDRAAECFDHGQFSVKNVIFLNLATSLAQYRSFRKMLI